MTMAIAILVAAAMGAAAYPGVGPRSYLTVWGGPACSSDTGYIESVGSCGCNNLQLYSGYEFNFRGESATLYNQVNCAGTPYQVFEDTRACGNFGWVSIDIHC